ncbi:hypothetical protein, partial [Streptomyces sp. NPDC058953]|uniref:hypothetical protein n=1 Tax=Streptomyces sp. NPDC058953 TaxID=3346676 RepID=UPI00369FAFFE
GPAPRGPRARVNADRGAGLGPARGFFRGGSGHHEAFRSGRRSGDGRVAGDGLVDEGKQPSDEDRSDINTINIGIGIG